MKLPYNAFMQPLTLILRTAGTNCDRELAHAFELAGSRTQTVHLHQLIEQPALLDQFDLIGFPGGFSYGDDIAAGRILANRLRHRLAEPLHRALQRGVPMIGICNGFQVLVKLGLLPFPDDMLTGQQSATLADNTSGRFIDRWGSLQAGDAQQSVCIWTQGLSELGGFDLPIAHGEGRFVPRDEKVLQQLQVQKQVALRYVVQQPGEKSNAHFVGNPNGSIDAIAGVCDPSGLVLGLMPHPERFVDVTQHPNWTRWSSDQLNTVTPGLRFFQNAVAYVKQRQLAKV